MKLIALQDFKWAHRGCIVEEFEKGQEIHTEDQDLIEVSRREGWTEDGDTADRARDEAAAARAAADAEAKAEAEAAAKDADEKASKPADNKARKAAPENK